MSLANCLAKLNAGKTIFDQDEIREINQAVQQHLHEGLGQDEAERKAVQAMLDAAVAERAEIVWLINEASPGAVKETKPAEQKAQEAAKNPKDVYRAYPLVAADREKLLERFPPTHARVIADHISAQSLGDMDKVAEGPAKGEVIGFADGGGIQSLTRPV